MTNRDVRTIASRYIAAWNETDSARRRAQIASLWTEDGSYVDPMAKAEGHDGIDALIGGVQARFPQFRFSLAGPLDGHGDRLRFSWNFGPEGNDPVVQGTDFAELADDGRLRAVTGFLDRVPPVP